MIQANKRKIKEENLFQNGIPEASGEGSEMTLLHKNASSDELQDFEGVDYLQLQENSGSFDLLKDSEEDAWNELLIPVAHHS
jgi:hypothetical protein